MSYIDREAAVELLSQPITMSLCLSVAECHHKIAQQWIDRHLIENIPAADVRPVKRGKWTLNKDGSGTCSECGFVQNSCWDLDNWDNFCHNCGADMREANDEKA